MAKWGVGKKLSGSSQDGSWVGGEGGYAGYAGYAPGQGHGQGVGFVQTQVQGPQGQMQGHERSTSAGSFLVGRGTMPGPQYLMNMHPGVPVYVK